MAVTCICNSDLLSVSRRHNPWPAVAALAALARHADWQVREAAAELAHPDRFRYLPDRDDLRRGTLLVIRALAEDRHPHVRAAAGWAVAGTPIGWEYPGDHEWHWGGREPYNPGLHADAAAGRAGSLPLAERELLANGAAGTVPPGLLADPVCLVRRWAVYQADPGMLTGPVWPDLYDDPCRWVFHALAYRVGPPDGADLTRLDYSSGAAAASATRSAWVLSELAARDETNVREFVAANPACPPEVLLTLGDDPDLNVRAAAYGNPGWPDDRPVRPSADPTTLTSNPFQLAGAVIGTRTPVRCMAGRSRVGNSSGWWIPPEDAVGFCDRDAVSLHSWGAFCRTHQGEVDDVKQHGGADGFLGQRNANGVWVHLFQCGPLDPRSVLWDGRAAPPGQ